jgi:uncharacterized HAD superfamily protein
LKKRRIKKEKMAEVMGRVPRERWGIDIDDTLTPFIEPFAVFHNMKYRTNLAKKDFVTFRFGRTIGCDGKEAKKRVDEYYKTSAFINSAPFPEALDAIPALARDRELFVITSRPYSVLEQTRGFIETYFPGIFSGIFHSYNVYSEGNAHSPTKYQICHNLGLSHFVDDSLDYVVSCKSEVDFVWLFGDNPWSQNGHLHPGILRAIDWHEILTAEISGKIK